MEIILNNLGKIVLGIVVAVVLALLIKNWKKIKQFILEVRAELGKVAWSTRQELMASTLVVIVVTVILGVFIGFIDILLSKLLSLLFK